MTIDAKETLELAEMLRIRLSDADARRLSADMSAVLDYVRLLDEVDVAGVDPMGGGAGGYAELRDDVPGSCLDPGDLESLSDGAFDPQLGAFTSKAVFS
ncbi:MAG: aspartyl/glutamyl-tRNA amidotransferase subunit C [Planctomycetota bacterium]|jgi:aspartyl-tRNA(Asn)/glutamyl-tRNA(Gln) amidotransferase subunit C|nr:aspartyl/glutamyl-tRNA amidotransferase subunit C [Planctomycetota bacterium]